MLITYCCAGLRYAEISSLTISIGSDAPPWLGSAIASAVLMNKYTRSGFDLIRNPQQGGRLRGKLDRCPDTAYAIFVHGGHGLDRPDFGAGGLRQAADPILHGGCGKRIRFSHEEPLRIGLLRLKRTLLLLILGSRRRRPCITRCKGARFLDGVDRIVPTRRKRPHDECMDE